MKNRIKERIRESGIMQKDIAEKLGMTAIGFSQLIRQEMPKIETYAKIADAIGVPIWSLLLSDDELDAIRAAAPKQNNATDVFRCPKCGATLKVIPADEEAEI